MADKLNAKSAALKSLKAVAASKPKPTVTKHVPAVAVKAPWIEPVKKPTVPSAKTVAPVAAVNVATPKLAVAKQAQASIIAKPTPIAKAPALKVTTLGAAAQPATPAPTPTAAIVVEPVPVKSVPLAIAAPPLAKPATAVITPPAKPAEPVKAPLITEGKTVMTETITKIEETAKNFAAETTSRAKTAMEKGSKGVEELVEFSKGNIEAIVASGRLAAKGAEEMAKYSADYGRATIEKANSAAKQLAGVKSPTEFFQMQSEMAKSSLDAAVAEVSKFSESYLKLLGEIVQPIQNRYAVAVEKVKTTVAA